MGLPGKDQNDHDVLHRARRRTPLDLRAKFPSYYTPYDKIDIFRHARRKGVIREADDVIQEEWLARRQGHKNPMDTASARIHEFEYRRSFLHSNIFETWKEPVSIQEIRDKEKLTKTYAPEDDFIEYDITPSVADEDSIELIELLGELGEGDLIKVAQVVAYNTYSQRRTNRQYGKENIAVGERRSKVKEVIEALDGSYPKGPTRKYMSRYNGLLKRLRRIIEEYSVYLCGTSCEKYVEKCK